MAKALKVCSTPGCPALTAQGRCPACKAKAEQARGSAASRGYGSRHRNTFRAEVLRRDPVCVVCRMAPATVADHYPYSRKQLVAQGQNPDDPRHGRGLCSSCHGKETQANPEQQGGWNAR